MSKYIKKLDEAEIIKTRESEHAVVRIAINDVLCGEAHDRQLEKISDYIYNTLYQQAMREAIQKTLLILNLL